MDEMTVDPTAELKKVKDILSKSEEDEEAVREKISALHILAEMMESLDVSRDLHLVGGLVPLIQSLKSDHRCVPATTAHVGPGHWLHLLATRLRCP